MNELIQSSIDVKGCIVRGPEPITKMQMETITFQNLLYILLAFGLVYFFFLIGVSFNIYTEVSTPVKSVDKNVDRAISATIIYCLFFF